MLLSLNMVCLTVAPVTSDRDLFHLPPPKIPGFTPTSLQEGETGYEKIKRKVNSRIGRTALMAGRGGFHDQEDNVKKEYY
jgi:hypothetical protein